jgi:hypothetical protein
LRKIESGTSVGQGRLEIFLQETPPTTCDVAGFRLLRPRDPARSSGTDRLIAATRLAHRPDAHAMAGAKRGMT